MLLSPGPARSLVLSTQRKGLGSAPLPHIVRVHGVVPLRAKFDDRKNFEGQVAEANKKVSEAIDQTVEAIKSGKAPRLDVDAKLDLSNLVKYNFFGQLFLTGVSWAVMFVTTHASLAWRSDINPATFILLIGVLLSGYSTWLAYGYMKKVNDKGVDALGFGLMNQFFDHILMNFAGAAAAIVALQAAVGTALLKGVQVSVFKAVETNLVPLQSLTQAAANTLLAHLVSILFLTLCLKKMSKGFKQLIEIGEKLKGVAL